ncbi:hypothetical protein ABTM09_20905, partial [Acinetobacter baumannii]
DMTLQSINMPGNYNNTLTSYMPNRELLQKRLALNAITDGTSQTMMLAEGYGSCTQGDFSYFGGDKFAVRENDWVMRG